MKELKEEKSRQTKCQDIVTTQNNNNNLKIKVES